MSITPLALHLLHDYDETHTDGSNQFIYSRFLIPHLMDYKGWAIFCDGDMLVRDDIARLWDMRDDQYAVMCVKHDYHTKNNRKYIGTALETHNVAYPRKNWSSVMLINCEHPSNRVLTPQYVMESTGAKLHRFEHLKDEEIGKLPPEWNALAREQPYMNDAALVHYTLGIPAMRHYADSDHSEEWFEARRQVTELVE